MVDAACQVEYLNILPDFMHNLSQIIFCGESNATLQNLTNCSADNTHLFEAILDGIPTEEPSTAQYFFTYFTPIIFVIGVLGNSLSLVVFLSKNMRKLSASIYLAALSSADLFALVFYVLPEWFKHGLSLLPGQHDYTVLFLQQHGTCQVVLYLQYIARFLSSWFVVFFTIERFIAVSFPLHRKHICDPRSASRVIAGAIVITFICCVFKPLLSGSYIALNGDPMCTSLHDHLYLSFVLDSLFGLAITFIPFVLITVLNLLIIRKLALRNKRQRKIRIVTEESIIRLEFTFILLAISICFVSLNLPYFVVWCKSYWIIERMLNIHAHSTSSLQTHNGDMLDLNQSLHVTRSVFYINYCINFFLYSFTGAYFRKQLMQLFFKKDRGYLHTHHNSAYYFRSNSHTTPHSWV